MGGLELPTSSVVRHFGLEQMGDWISYPHCVTRYRASSQYGTNNMSSRQQTADDLPIPKYLNDMVRRTVPVPNVVIP